MNVAYNMDCMEYMKTLPDKAFELAIVDPPYGIGVQGMNYCKSGAKRIGKAVRRDYRRDAEWDIKPNAEYFTEFLKPSGGWIVWEKGVPEGMSLSQAELAWTNCLNSVRIQKFLWAGYKKCEETDRFHPTQKPVALYEWLLTHYAKQGDKILDTHLGSGSSRIACYNLGFDFVGCEIDEDYFKAQEERYQAHIAQASLFV